MEALILSLLFVCFTLFVMAQIIIFRKIEQARVVVWLKYIIVLSNIGFTLLFVLIIPYILPRLRIISYLISLMTFNLFVVAYILGVFGMVVSSLRIRILSEIAHRGERGLSIDNLLRHYNKEAIIKERVRRLIQTGDIFCEKGTYRLNNRFSLFLFHKIVFDVLGTLYKTGAGY